MDTQYINDYQNIENDREFDKYLKYLDYKSGMSGYYSRLPDDKNFSKMYYELKNFPNYGQFNLERKMLFCSWCFISWFEFSTVKWYPIRKLSRSFSHGGISKNKSTFELLLKWNIKEGKIKHDW